MIYLDQVIGFSFVMLVFASAVSVVQSSLKRLLSLKGREVVEPVLDALKKQWQGGRLLVADWPKFEQTLRAEFTRRGSPLNLALHSASVTDAGAVLGALRRFGDKDILRALGAVVPTADIAVEWDRMISDLEEDWDNVAARLSQSYESHTQTYVFILSAAAALLFNVDAVRIIRVLGVNQETRAALVKAAQNKDPKTGEAGIAADVNVTLTEWQKADLKELEGSGLPIGWEFAPLTVCTSATGHSVGRLRTPCAGDLAKGDTLLLWFVRLFGLLIGAGLISQGAPFWYSLIDQVLGLKGKLNQSGNSSGTMAQPSIPSDANEPAVAAAGGEDEVRSPGEPTEAQIASRCGR